MSVPYTFWSAPTYGPDDVRTPYAPENAATLLRTLRELSNRNWNVWFTLDGSQTSPAPKSNQLCNSYFLGYDLSQIETGYSRQTQMVLFSAATNTWRTDLASPLVEGDLGIPTYTPGPWTGAYTITSAGSNRPGDTDHPDEYTRMTDAILDHTTPGTTLLVLVVDGSLSYYNDSGFSAWESDIDVVPGIFQLAAALVPSFGPDDTLVVLKCGDYDTQVATTVLDYGGESISVGGDNNRYGGDENDFEDVSPTYVPAKPSVLVYETSMSGFSLDDLHTAWFAETVSAGDLDDMAETMLEGVRHGIGYGSVNGPFDNNFMVIATDTTMKAPVDQFFPDFSWPDLPLVTDSFGPIDVDVQLSGDLTVLPWRYVESNDLDVDITMSAMLIPVFEVDIEGTI